MIKGIMVELPVEVLPHGADLPLPAYMSDGAAGMDLYAALDETVDLEPGAIKIIPTGLKVAVPQGYELQIRPRSGLAARFGISLVNSPGTIDADYRGEVKVILINLGPAGFAVHRGDRIAQMILCPIPRIELLPVASLPATGRGEGGLGHTGIK